MVNNSNGTDFGSLSCSSAKLFAIVAISISSIMKSVHKWPITTACILRNIHLFFCFLSFTHRFISTGEWTEAMSIIAATMSSKFILGVLASESIQ